MFAVKYRLVFAHHWSSHEFDWRPLPTTSSCLAALALAPWAQALLLQIPVAWQSSSPANISWSHTATDPAFTLQLVNTDEFHDTFSIANNVNPDADFDAFTLPVIPQGTYTLRAINVTNAGQVFDETPSFTIQGPPDSSTHSSAASTASASASASSGTLTVPASQTTASGSAVGSSTGFGVTVSNSGSAAASNTGATAASSGSSSSSAATPSNFNNGAASLPHLAPWAIAALSVVAGAAAIL
uniref:Zcf29p n=1 Tax=Ganoderma boninense TaxID=34458 RepID=A0A5K1JS88_9APHY|nr:Zcf29p [Ganoderma boninense]